VSGTYNPAAVTSPPIQPYSVANYASAFQALLPLGRAWPRAAGTLQADVCAALVPTYYRNDEAACGLVQDAFPSTSVYLLPEWESSLGLPDPCAGEAPTIAAREAQVVARLCAGGSPSADFFISYAATLGYGITISTFTPWRFGDTFETPLYNDDWAFTWRVYVNSPSVTSVPEILVCEFNNLKPAHTYVGFVIPTSPFILDLSLLDGPNVLV